jgi:hypothetical protein
MDSQLLKMFMHTGFVPFLKSKKDLQLLLQMKQLTRRQQQEKHLPRQQHQTKQQQHVISLQR